MVIPTRPTPRVQDFMKTIRPFFAEHLECEYCKQTHCENKSPHCGAPKPVKKIEGVQGPSLLMEEHRKLHQQAMERKEKTISVLKIASIIGLFVTGWMAGNTFWLMLKGL